MRLLNDGPLALLLDDLGALDQDTNSARLELALGRNDDRLALLELAGPAPLLVETLGVAPLAARQAPTGAGEAGRHEGGAAEDEADGAAVDAYAGEAAREAVDELEVRQQHVRLVVLEEERLALEHVQGAAVGKLHGFQGAFLGQQLVDHIVQERVGRREGLAQRALDAGF